MKATLKYTVTGLIFFFLGVGFLYFHIVHSLIISYSNFDKFDGNVYVDDRLEENEKREFFLLLDEAKNRIMMSFGEYTATPKIIVVSTDENAKKYGLGGAPGIVHIIPWGQYMVINASKAGIDVIAHELLHTEVVNRLGYFVWQTKFPVWLNEGLAMQVDNRAKYKVLNNDISNEEFSRIILLKKSSQFWTKSKEKNIEHYRLANAAVGKILQRFDKFKMYSKLKRIREGEKSYIVFEIEETSKALM